MRIVAFVGASILLAVLPAILARPASGGTVRLTCRDGDPDVVVSPRGLGGPAFCNHDLPGDSACTFAICSLCPLLRGCVGPESGVCPEGEPPPPEAKVITVKVGRKRVRRVGATRIVFRCREPAPCDDQHNYTAVAWTCHDGVSGEGRCDFDQQVNGVCSFPFFCLEVCGSVPRETVVVPVGETRIIQRPRLPETGVTQFTLRCLSP